MDVKEWGKKVFTVLHWWNTGPSGVPFPVEVPVGAPLGSPKIYNRSWCDRGRISGRLQQSGRRLAVFVVSDVLAHLDASWIPASYLALTVPLA
jgi:hypothetical protein